MYKGKTYKENTKYKLIGYTPVGIYYNVPREQEAEFKNGGWVPYGKNKMIRNFVIENIIEL